MPITTMSNKERNNSNNNVIGGNKDLTTLTSESLQVIEVTSSEN